MKRISLPSLLTVLSLLTSLALTSCGDSQDKAANDMISLFNRMGDTLGTIKDKASAEAAKGKLTGLVAEMKALKVRTDKFGSKPDDKIKEKYDKPMQEAMQKFTTSLMQAMTAGPDAQEALKELTESMSTLK